MYKTFSSGRSHSKPASQRSKKSALNLATLNEPSKLRIGGSREPSEKGSHSRTLEDPRHCVQETESPYGLHQDQPLHRKSHRPYENSSSASRLSEKNLKRLQVANPFATISNSGFVPFAYKAGSRKGSMTKS